MPSYGAESDHGPERRPGPRPSSPDRADLRFGTEQGGNLAAIRPERLKAYPAVGPLKRRSPTPSWPIRNGSSVATALEGGSVTVNRLTVHDLSAKQAAGCGVPPITEYGKAELSHAVRRPDCVAVLPRLELFHGRLRRRRPMPAWTSRHFRLSTVKLTAGRRRRSCRERPVNVGVEAGFQDLPGQTCRTSAR